MPTSAVSIEAVGARSASGQVLSRECIDIMEQAFREAAAPGLKWE